MRLFPVLCYSLFATNSSEQELYMRDTIIKLFNLEPSDLEDVEVVSTDYSVFAIITLKVRRQQCPACGCSTKRIHDYRKRTLTHAVLNDVYTTIVFNQRRYRCINCNKTFPEANPFAFPNRRVSSYVILRVMKMLRNPRMTFSQVADDVNLSVSSVCRIFDKYAGVTPIALPECLCIDEVYTIKYKQKIYACVLVNMQTSQVYDLLPSRKKAELSQYFSRISREERCKVKYICMDMYQLYKDVAEVYFPKAKICVDSFHVIQQINKAFTSVRVRVMKSFERTSEEYQLLKCFSWLLIKDSSRIDLYEPIDLHKYYYCVDSRYVAPRVLINKILSWDYDLNAAYSMKEEYAYINRTSNSENAETRIENFIGELLLYDVKELKRIAKMLRHWKAEIVNSFDRVNGQRISNGPIESVNAKIDVIKLNGNGYRNFERFKLRVLYSLNENSSIKV